MVTIFYQVNKCVTKFQTKLTHVYTINVIIVWRLNVDIIAINTPLNVVPYHVRASCCESVYNVHANSELFQLKHIL